MLLKKLGKWILSVFAISTAYSAVTKAMSTLSNYNTQIKTDLEYIQYALASALQPIVEKIIQLSYKLLGYVSLIAKAWFNIDIFANSSASAFADANKEATSLSKTVAGFDEMNILSDSSSSSSITTPSYDLSGMEDIEVPDWFKWVLDNGDKLKNNYFRYCRSNSRNEDS